MKRIATGALLAFVMVGTLATAQSGVVLPPGSNTLKSLHMRDHPALGIYESTDGTMYIGGTSGGITCTDTACSVTGSFPLLAPDGSTTAPSYSFTNDSTAGMFMNSPNSAVQVHGGEATGTDTALTGSAKLSAAQGTGTGAGGGLALQVAPPALSSGSTLNAHQNLLFAHNNGHVDLGGVNTPTTSNSRWSGSNMVTGATDGNGGTVWITGGVGTGAGVPGYIFFRTGSVEASGSTQQTLVTRAAVTEDGLEMAPVLFANLNGSATNGTISYCSDCTKATPCAGSGNGALAKRLNGAWDCD